VHIPSVALGAGIAISCLVLGIFLANFIDMEDSQLLAEIPTITNIEKQQSVRGPDILVKNGSPILGSVDAPITLVEFGDYQCSFCKRHFDQTHDLIMKNYVETNKVKILFKDLIVTPGKDSMHAAHATHCAKDQGMFWKYHYMLYNNWEGENTGWVTTDNLNKFAQKIDMNMNEFSKCMSENKWMELITASKNDANTLGITGTPSFFLIGPENELEKIHGAQPYDVFKEIFDSHLKK
jgi:protein-disulfide isomerase